MDLDIENKNRGNGGEEKDSIGKITGFFLFRNLINNYNDAKNMSEEERKQIKKYGVLSVILAITSIIVSVSCLISTFTDFQFFGFSYVLIMFSYILGGVIICLIFSIYSFVFAVMQVRLNRKAIGIFGIVLAVLGILSSLALGLILIL